MAKILKAENIQTDVLGSNGDGAFSLQRNNSSLLTLYTNDCVGINSTAPSHKLEVRGSSTPKIAIVSDDQLINQGASFRIDLKNASSQLFEGGNISVRHSASNQTAGAESTYMSFSTKNAGSLSERMRITPNGGIAFGGAANYGTTAHVLKSAGDASPVWGFITNANIDSAAAIAYSKLNLASSITSSDIVDGTIVDADINANAAIAYSKLATLSSGNIVLGSSGNVATSTSVTGDVTISSTGVTSISSGVIVNADINANAAIADTKLATISTAGKVSNSATTATAANTASTIVLRDASNNFSAETITATTFSGALSGNATTATTATTVSNSSITFAKLSTSATEADNVTKRTAKAWVNFNGTGTVQVSSSFNVTSITDNGVGDYTINFTAALANATYAVSVCGSAGAATVGSNYVPLSCFLYPNATATNILTTGTCRVWYAYPNVYNNCSSITVDVLIGSVVVYAT
jgi:hypothetical protein